jgi:putative SOS response-associated peptidase YedK
MCYSVMVTANFSKLRRKFNAQIDFDQIERTFQQRIQFGPKAFLISRAVEFNFDNPQSAAEERVKKLIDEYRMSRGAEIESELFEQKMRLTKAERAMKEAGAAGKPPTKKVLNDQRVATNKVESLTRWKTDLWRTDEKPRDSRIFANHFCPIIVNRDGGNVIQLGRYLLRRKGMPPSFDFKYSGCYNARRDSALRFWRPEFGKTHAVMLVQSFFENVERNGKNAVAHFTPQDGQDMIIACLYSEWGNANQDGFLSFAAMTDEPPAEVQAAGHDRIIISLDDSAVGAWLTPSGASDDDLMKVLDLRARPIYDHQILEAAA